MYLARLQEPLHRRRMNFPRPSSRLPAAALSKFEAAAKRDWEEGVALDGLLDRVNRIAALIAPEGGGGESRASRDSRVSRVFGPRSFRHYQTLGAIDPPARAGGRVVYGFRHLVQALLVRRLLWERVPAERIVAMVAGRTTEETRRMFLGGIEIVAQYSGGGGVGGEADPLGPEPAGTWMRIPVAPGIELHLREGPPRFRPGDVGKLLAALESVLRRQAR